MSTMSRRVLTVTVAAVIAVFTGVLVGLLSARASCTPVLAPKAAASPAAAQTTAVSSPVAGLGGSHAEPVRPSAAPAEPAAVAERQPVCGSRDTFEALPALAALGDRKSTRLNSSHVRISYAVFCLKKKKKKCLNDSFRKKKKKK